MNRKLVLVEYISDINEVIRRPLQFTQRIKFTCFDVCKHFIIFGATSGGIYVFNRHPCKFLKLIPSKEGSVSQISIAPDEKTIALSSIKGLMVVLENCFDDLNLQYSVYSEHEGATVTAIKWLRNELYCGDNTGKVSVITLTNLLAKAMFQTPSASLMQLDSAVVQIDVFSHFLLISTQTRSYLCNTVKEQYRQIGKKLRDGPFGACFFNTSKVTDCNETQTSVARGLFRTLKDDETFSDSNENDVKIFVSRPGARLWEVSFEASVIYTHQFRDSLKKVSSDIIHLNQNPASHLSLSTGSSERIPDSFNFEKVYSLLDKYIFTFKKSGFFFFLLEKVSLEFWSSYYENIKDIKIYNEYLYIWDEVQINVVALVDLEHLILKTLFKNQFTLCSELCLLYQKDILELVPISNRIHLILSLQSELEAINAEVTLQELQPIFQKIQEFSNNRAILQKIKNGIVVVDNTHNIKNTICDTKLKENVSYGVSQTDISNNEVDDKMVSFVPNKLSETNPFSVISYDMNVFYQQYQLNKINSNLQTCTLEELLNKKNLNSVIDLFKDFINYGVTLKDEKKSLKLWSYNQCLKYISTKNFDNITPNSGIVQFLTEAFNGINETQNNHCCCMYPTPHAHNNKVLFYKIGCEIIKLSANYNDILKSVPHMWKFVITNLWYQNDIRQLLPIIIQYSDENVVSLFLNRFTYDNLDDAIQLLIKLKKGICLNCESKINVSDAISWTNFGILMVQTVGGICTTKLLQRYANYIPNQELTENFYQTCLFTSTVDGFKEGIRKDSISVVTQLLSNEKTKQKFNTSLEKFLHQKYAGRITNVTNQIPCSENANMCFYCELSLNIPILNDTCKLKCGHTFHKMCLMYNNEVCIFCKVIS